MLLDQTDFLVVGVIGPQGVGKSTLLSVLGGAGPFTDSRFVILQLYCFVKVNLIVVSLSVKKLFQHIVFI